MDLNDPPGPPAAAFPGSSSQRYRPSERDTQLEREEIAPRPAEQASANENLGRGRRAVKLCRRGFRLCRRNLRRAANRGRAIDSAMPAGRRPGGSGKRRANSRCAFPPDAAGGRGDEHHSLSPFRLPRFRPPRCITNASGSLQPSALRHDGYTAGGLSPWILERLSHATHLACHSHFLSDLVQDRRGAAGGRNACE